MNIFHSEVELDDQFLKFHLGGDVVLRYLETAFSADLRDQLLNVRKVTLGVRPYAVRLGDVGVSAEVYANQWLGDQSHVAARFAAGSVISVSHDRVSTREGETICIEFPVADLHIFDTHDGSAISHGGKPA